MNWKPFKSFIIALSPLGLLILLSSAAHGHFRCEAIFTGQKRMPVETSVEVEIVSNEKVMNLFTTTDGTIAPVLEGTPLTDLPLNLRRDLQKFAGADGDPYKISWDLLSYQEKVVLIDASVKARGQMFMGDKRDRVVHGLKFKEEVVLQFSEPRTEFLGQVFLPGSYVFQAKEIFGNTKIEFMGPSWMNRKNLGFEIHVRSDLPAKETFFTARSLQKSLIGQVQNMHMHVVFPKRSRMSSNEAFRVVDSVRVFQMYLEMLMIRRGVPLKDLKTPGGPPGASAFYVPEQNMEPLANLYSMLMQGFPSAHSSKHGVLGLRSPHAYDSDVWGMEVRYLSPHVHPQILAEAIGGIQKRMMEADYFISEKDMAAYLARGPNVTSALYGLSPIEKVWNLKLPVEKHSLLVRKIFEENYFLTMLAHDWSSDPMYYNNPVRLQKIKEEQEYSLKLLFNGLDSTEVMRHFIKKTGLEHDITNLVHSAR